MSTGTVALPEQGHVLKRCAPQTVQQACPQLRNCHTIAVPTLPESIEWFANGFIFILFLNPYLRLEHLKARLCNFEQTTNPNSEFYGMIPK